MGGTWYAASSCCSSRRPTWGPLPCVRTREVPPATRSASEVAVVCSAARISSTEPVAAPGDSALPPSATTTRTPSGRAGEVGGSDESGVVAQLREQDRCVRPVGAPGQPLREDDARRSDEQLA